MYSGIIPIIKQAALDAVDSTQPVNITYGTVTSTSPLKIQVTPKLVLGEGNVLLSRNVTKHSVPVSFSGTTDSAQGHSHPFSVSKSITIDNSLKKGDIVILARVQGGSTYLVLDKAVKK